MDNQTIVIAVGVDKNTWFLKSLVVKRQKRHVLRLFLIVASFYGLCDTKKILDGQKQNKKGVHREEQHENRGNGRVFL